MLWRGRHGRKWVSRQEDGTMVNFSKLCFQGKIEQAGLDGLSMKVKSGT